MARLLGPDADSRAVFYRGPFGGEDSAAGRFAVMYTDEALTTLADIATYDGTGTPGASIAGSKVTVDSSSRLPKFWFPDGVDRLWAKVANTPAFEVNADYDARIDAGVPIDALTYSGKDHGLAGDGTTNDRAALQALVTALNASYVADGRPRVIYCPPGDYSIRDNGVVWKSGVSLVGAGPGLTRFKLSNPVNTTNPTPLATYTTAQGASTSAPLVDCTFADFEVDGSGVSLASYNTGAKAFVLQFMQRARFRNLYLHDCAATGLGCDFLQDTIIDGVVSVNNGRLNNGTQAGGAGIGIGIGGWGSVERTTIVNCTAVGNGTHGIFVELQDNTYTPPRGIRIVGCHAEGNRYGISDWGADGLVVSGCTILGNLQHGFNVSGSGVAAIAGRGGNIVGNVIDGNAVDGVCIGDTPGPYTVRGNRISNNGRYGYHQLNVVQASSFAGVEVMAVDNDVRGNALDGVRVDGVLTDATISNNRVRNNGQQSAGATSSSGANVTYGLLSVTDTGQAWTVNAQVGKTVTVGAQTAVVASNTATVLTLWPARPNGTTAWATSTPSAAAAYSLAAAPSTRAALTFNAAANSATVRNNRCWDNQTPKTQTHGWWITSSGSAGSARAEGNDLLGNLTAAFLFDTTPSGGFWSHNPGMSAGAATSTSTTLVDGAELVSGQLRYAAQIRNWVSGTLTPSASANTAGTAQTCTPSTGQQGFGAFMLISVLYAGTFNSETATATITATFSDATTGTATITATATGRQNLAASGFITVTKEAKYVTQVAVTLQSTITSSAVTATANVVALQV